MTGNVVLFTTAALIGQSLATDKALSTLPLGIMQISTMLSTIPASLLMQWIGRRLGFMAGVGLGMVGAGLGIAAIATQSFLLFCGATLLLGSSNSFAGFYRFAAAEAATESFRSQAISLVVSGGVVAALAGPPLASWAKDLLPHAFMGSWMAIVVLQGLTFFALAPVTLPKVMVQGKQEKSRPLGMIVRQPSFVVAVLGSMIGYGVMVLVMTATPLAIVAHNHPFHDAAMVIQWHILGMFAPSFVTGALIARFGVLTIMNCGSALSLLCILINLFSVHHLHSELVSTTIALLSLGIGWNFLYIGSTTLLTETYTPAEKAKVQALHDFLMFGFVAFATFLSGGLFERLGWQAVNWAGLPMMAIVAVAVFWLYQRRMVATR